MKKLLIFSALADFIFCLAWLELSQAVTAGVTALIMAAALLLLTLAVESKNDKAHRVFSVAALAPIFSVLIFLFLSRWQLLPRIILLWLLLGLILGLSLVAPLFKRFVYNSPYYKAFKYSEHILMWQISAIFYFNCLFMTLIILGLTYLS